MKEKFTLRHDREKEGRALSFIPFGEGVRKSKLNAIAVRKFLRSHISSTQYDEILKQLCKDLEIYKGEILIKQSEYKR